MPEPDKYIEVSEKINWKEEFVTQGRIARNSVRGKLTRVKSCQVAPRVLANIEKNDGKTQYLEAQLYGGRSQLNIALTDVVDIQKPSQLCVALTEIAEKLYSPPTPIAIVGGEEE